MSECHPTPLFASTVCPEPPSKTLNHPPPAPIPSAHRWRALHGGALRNFEPSEPLVKGSGVTGLRVGEKGRGGEGSGVGWGGGGVG